MERKITKIIILLIVSVVITLICSDITRSYGAALEDRITGGFVLAAVLIASGLIFMKLDSINKKLDSITKGNNDKDN